MVRPTVAEADALIGVRHPVLSHGFVALVDYMGNDAAIVQAARVSYGRGTKSVRDDRALIRYLMRHRHTTPFEMVEYKFLVRLPIYVARQFVRHRTASINGPSARYSIVPDEYEVPPAEEVRQQSTRNHQGRGDALPKEIVDKFRTDLERVAQESYRDYTAALNAGVAGRPPASSSRSPTTPSGTGRRTSTTCSIFCRSAWTPTPRRRSDSSPSRWRRSDGSWRRSPSRPSKSSSSRA